MKASETIHASVTVKNTGDREGTETLQLYLHDKAASVVRPVKELKGFQKITLQPCFAAIAFLVIETLHAGDSI